MADRLCKEKNHLKKVPFIIVTAEYGEDVREAVKEAKADGFISKPAKISEVIALLNNHSSNSI